MVYYVKPKTYKEKKTKSIIVRLKQAVFWGSPGTGQLAVSP